MARKQLYVLISRVGVAVCQFIGGELLHIHQKVIFSCRYIMKKNYYKGNWIFLVIPAWLTLLWMHTQTLILMILHMLWMKKVPQVLHNWNNFRQMESTVKTFKDPETTMQTQSTRDGQILFDYLVDRCGFRQEYLDTL